MKLKYYLRGLGTGIAVATLIIAISAGSKGSNTMTDEEILARAKELGLVERTVLSDMVKDDESDENTEEVVEDNTVESEPEDAEAVADETTQESVAEDTDNSIEPMANETDTENTDEETSEATPEEPDVEVEQKAEDNEVGTDGNSFGMPDEAGTVTIVVKSGASSDSVSKQLEVAGLVDSATAYDKYLCQNGYDKSIRVGTYEIPADATGEEIAQMITGR